MVSSVNDPNLQKLGAAGRGRVEHRAAPDSNNKTLRTRDHKGGKPARNGIPVWDSPGNRVDGGEKTHLSGLAWRRATPVWPGSGCAWDAGVPGSGRPDQLMSGRRFQDGATRGPSAGRGTSPECFSTPVCAQAATRSGSHYRRPPCGQLDAEQPRPGSSTPKKPRRCSASPRSTCAGLADQGRLPWLPTGRSGGRPSRVYRRAQIEVIVRARRGRTHPAADHV